MKSKIGILAFGSLIEKPGNEINEIEIERIDCETPFKVEFARISSTRGNAPTLIPILDNSKGLKVKAKIILIDNKVSLEEAKSILWRRECHKSDILEKYITPKKINSNYVYINVLENFCNIEKVIFTYFIIQDEYKDLSPSNLADFAINSVRTEAGEKGDDGISYLLSIKKNGIITEYSDRYEKEILIKTDTTSLEEALKNIINNPLGVII